MDEDKTGKMDYRRGTKRRLRLSAKRHKSCNLRGWYNRNTTDNTSENTELHQAGPSFPTDSMDTNRLFEEPIPSTSSTHTNQTSLPLASQGCRKRLFSSDSNATSASITSTADMQIAEDHAATVESSCEVEGRRIVDFQFFFESLKAVSLHNSPMECSLQNLSIIKEERKGLKSVYTLRCDMCQNSSLKLCTEDFSQKVDVNECAVAGIMNIGSGFSHLESLTSSLNIPPMNYKQYSKIHQKVATAWEVTAQQSMKAAAEEEKEIAVKSGNIDKDGTPLIKVVCDGSWAKRSYRSNYTSLSGVGAIVGYNTKKVLYIGVKNKYCTVCARASNAGREAPQHMCFKNWSNSSTSMESAAIVEGFLKSEEMYGVRYHQMIADGDSSCYKKILDAKPYKTLTVQKIECRNHLLRNLCNKLRDITKQTKAGPSFLRKLVASKILKCRTAVRKATEHWKNLNIDKNTKILELRKDILNIPSHVFGEHKNCKSRQYFCNKESPDENNTVPDLKKYQLHEGITNIFQTLSQHSKSLIHDVDSNYVEQFNSIICKFIGGKRVNFAQRQSYQARCSAAVVSSNTKKPFYHVYKHLAGYSPGKFAKKMEEQRAHVIQKRTYTTKKKTLTNVEPDKDYGPASEKPDMDPEEYQRAEKEYLATLATTKEEREDLEFRTRNQSDSDDWMYERQKLLTTSNFGAVCRRLPHTSCQNIIKRLLYSKIQTKETFWGQMKESVAREKLCEEQNIQVKKCGLIVDPEHPFLGSSPDGLIGMDGVLEIKCPYSARMMTPEEGVKNKKIKFWSFKNNEFVINKKHYWYYQVQGQLHVTRRNYCLLAVWTPLGIKTEKITRNDVFWEKEMEKKLIMFYKKCLLPELVDSRFRRGLSIRDPDYIVEHQKNRIKGSK